LTRARSNADLIATAQQEFEPTYNAAPSQLLPIIATYAPNDIVLARWGFVPEDWHNAKIRPQNNARVETAGGSAQAQRHWQPRTGWPILRRNS
jgi:putative SOS response-associated peptidase YedK